MALGLQNLGARAVLQTYLQHRLVGNGRQREAHDPGHEDGGDDAEDQEDCDPSVEKCALALALRRQLVARAAVLARLRAILTASVATCHHARPASAHFEIRNRLQRVHRAARLDGRGHAAEVAVQAVVLVLREHWALVRAPRPLVPDIVVGDLLGDATLGRRFRLVLRFGPIPGRLLAEQGGYKAKRLHDPALHMGLDVGEEVLERRRIAGLSTFTKVLVGPQGALRGH
mmetsp:Transcript_134764/g.430633  ORF Transcript_134764/g.430633 Transcript_134764/m.430633 type:complete len:229 (-) Transcript_134764:139-825(-)